MRRSLVVPLLLAIPLAIAGCGGSGATPRTAAGVRSDYVQFSKLAAAGNGAAACSRYVSPTVVAELDAVGGCAKLLDYAVAQKGLNPGTVTNGWTASVNGSNATYQTASASGTAVYADGHWMFAENSSTSPTSTPPKSEDAAAKELAHTAQVAIETCAINNNGHYRPNCASPTALNGYESTIQTASGNGDAWLSAVTATTNSYTVTATAISGDRFSINRLANGSLTWTCTPSSAGGCTDGSW
jgi:hypothetical protein